MKENTHISEIRKKYEFNRLFILMATGLTDYQYNTILFEQGMIFLDLEYPPQTDYEEFRKFVAYDKDFWNWWQSVWKKHENDFVEFVSEWKCVFTAKFYTEEMEQITHESTTSKIFYEQYQKPRFKRAKEHYKAAIMVE